MPPVGCALAGQLAAVAARDLAAGMPATMARSARSPACNDDHFSRNFHGLLSIHRRRASPPSARPPCTRRQEAAVSAFLSRLIFVVTRRNPAPS
eukprot:4278788-Prymnesium_polylepis.1